MVQYRKQCFSMFKVTLFIYLCVWKRGVCYFAHPDGGGRAILSSRNGEVNIFFLTPRRCDCHPPPSSTEIYEQSLIPYFSPPAFSWHDQRMLRVLYGCYSSNFFFPPVLSRAASVVTLSVYVHQVCFAHLYTPHFGSTDDISLLIDYCAGLLLFRDSLRQVMPGSWWSGTLFLISKDRSWFFSVLDNSIKPVFAVLFLSWFSPGSSIWC